MLATRRLSVRPFTNATPGVPLRAVSVSAASRSNGNKLTSSTVGSEVDFSSVGTSSQQGRAAPKMRTRAAEPEEAAAPEASSDDRRGGDRRRGGGDDRRGRRGPNADVPTQKHFLPLPKPAHLVFIKPTVAVVTDVASRNSVGLKMTAGNAQLERFVIEYYARSVK